jgi:hypothetical protein
VNVKKVMDAGQAGLSFFGKRKPEFAPAKSAALLSTNPSRNFQTAGKKISVCSETIAQPFMAG